MDYSKLFSEINRLNYGDEPILIIHTYIDSAAADLIEMKIQEHMEIQGEDLGNYNFVMESIRSIYSEIDWI